MELTIDAASVDTGNRKRDHHLRSNDFFAVAEHPRVRFTSTRVHHVGDGRLRVEGDLAAAGTVVPLEFDATVQRIGRELHVEATTTVDQEHLRMSSGLLGMVRRPASLHVKARLSPTMGGRTVRERDPRVGYVQGDSRDIRDAAARAPVADSEAVLLFDREGRLVAGRLAQGIARVSSLREGIPMLHNQQVADLAAAIADHIEHDAGLARRSYLAGWLHDIGKVAIPDRVLAKAGPLTAEEWIVMPRQGVAVARATLVVEFIDNDRRHA